MNLNEIDLADIDWDFNAAWSWSAPVRAVVILVSCLVLIGVGVYYDTLDQFAALEVAEKKEAELKTIFELKLDQAANLP
ncbi:MAG: pilus assembly protein PilO, partial [Methylococcales bacterium]|nr:pilus assembly protein PilO [Methylococcales bacterium]